MDEDGLCEVSGLGFVEVFACRKEGREFGNLGWRNRLLTALFLVEGGRMMLMMIRR